MHGAHAVLLGNGLFDRDGAPGVAAIWVAQAACRRRRREHASRPAPRLEPFPHPLTQATTDGTLLIWPQEFDTDAMFIARMIRTE